MMPVPRWFLLSCPAFVGLVTLSLQRPDPGTCAASIDEIRPRRVLTLVYRARDDDLSRRIIPRLRDLAEVYRDAGLSVGISGHWPLDEPLIHRTRERAQQDGPLLTMRRRDGTLLAAMEEEALDLYYVYRVCERELHGRNRVTLAEHVEQLIDGRVANECRVESIDERQRNDLEDILRAGPVSCLLVPPGCGECMLEKHAAALGRLFRLRHDLQALVFDPGVLDGLRERGWRGAAWLLHDDAESRLLSLRQAGSYLPVLVGMDENGRIEVRSIRSGGGS